MVLTPVSIYLIISCFVFVKAEINREYSTLLGLERTERNADTLSIEGNLKWRSLALKTDLNILPGL